MARAKQEKKRKAGGKGKDEQNASLKDTLMVHKNKVVDNTDGTGAVSEIGTYGKRGPKKNAKSGGEKTRRKSYHSIAFTTSTKLDETTVNFIP